MWLEWMWFDSPNTKTASSDPSSIKLFGGLKANIAVKHTAF